MIVHHAAAREKVAKTEALTRLGIARRERLDRGDFDVYVGGLDGFSASVVRRACERLQAMPEPEHGPRFPTLATVVGVCRAVAEDERIRRALAAPAGERATPERLAQLLEAVKAAVGRHGMP